MAPQPCVRRRVAVSFPMHYTQEGWEAGQRYQVKKCPNEKIAKQLLLHGWEEAWDSTGAVWVVGNIWIQTRLNHGGDTRPRVVQECRRPLESARKRPASATRKRPASASAGGGAVLRRPAVWANKTTLVPATYTEAVALSEMPCFIVNLPEHEARRKQSMDLAMALGTAPMCPRGIKGIDLVESIERSPEGFALLTLNTHGRARLDERTYLMKVTSLNTAPGALGCSLSHNACLSLVPATQEFSLILEDDAACQPGLDIKAIPHVIRALTGQALAAGHELDVLFLGGYNSWKCPWDTELHREQSLATISWGGRRVALRRISGWYGAHAYVVSKRIIAPLQEYIGNGFTADSAIIRLLRNKRDLTGAGFFVESASRGRATRFTRLNLIKQTTPKNHIGGSTIRGALARAAAKKLMKRRQR